MSTAKNCLIVKEKFSRFTHKLQTASFILQIKRKACHIFQIHISLRKMNAWLQVSLIKDIFCLKGFLIPYIKDQRSTRHGRVRKTIKKLWMKSKKMKKKF